MSRHNGLYRNSIVACAATLLALASLSAQADPCVGFADGMPTGPVTAGLLDGDLGTGHRVCGRSEVGLDAGGLLLVDMPEFYGHLSAGGTLDGSLAVSKRVELFASLEFLRFENVITPIPATATGLGHTTLGAGWAFLLHEKVALGVNGKFVLPTAVGIYENAWPMGMDIGLAGQFAVSKKVQFHAQAAFLSSAAISKGASDPQVGGAVTLGTELRPGKAFAFVFDLYGNFGYRSPLEALAIAMGFRFSDGKRFGFEVAAIVPFAGRERALVRLDLRASIRLGKFEPYADDEAPDVTDGP